MNDLCFSEDEDIIACLHGYREASGDVQWLCRSCSKVGKELCTLRGIPEHVLCEEREGLLGRYYCACCPLSEKGLRSHKYVPISLCPDIGQLHHVEACRWCAHPYCDRCPFGCKCHHGDWHTIHVSFRAPSESVPNERRSRWATWAAAFSSFAITEFNGRRAFDLWPASQLETDWMGIAPPKESGAHGRMTQNTCVHMIRGRDAQAARRRAIADHRQALHIQAWDADLDYSATRCVHSVGLTTGVDPRDAARGRRTLLEHCLRCVAPLWVRMSARERTSIPAELVEKVSQKAASAGYGT